MTRFTRVLAALTLLCCLAPGSFAQIVVPSFGVRGEVPQPLVARFMDLFRQQLELRSNQAVLPGTTLAQTLVGQLSPDVAAAIATLGGGRYSVAGEIIAVESALSRASYTVNLLVTDARTRRSSDLLSQPLTAATLPQAVATLTRSVSGFINPASAPARGSASVFITSEPAGATILINGVPVGQTARAQNPLVPLAPGAYDVEVRKEGYLPERDTVQLGRDDTEFMAFTLTEARGGSILVSSVPNATIFLDGRRVGRTPLTVTAAPGVRRLRLERPGFASATQAVTVRNLFVTRVPVIYLEPSYDNLVFWTPPTGFRVAINGLERSRNFAANLPPGEHEGALLRGDDRIPFRFVLPARGIFELDVRTRDLTPLPQR